MFNKGIETTVQGNLTEAPVLRAMADGTAVTNFSIANNRTYTNNQNQRITETGYVRLSLFGVQAQNAAMYLVKGQAVTVRGRLIIDSKTGGPKVYARNNGYAGAKFELRVDEIDYGRKPERHYAAAAQAGYANGNTPPAPPGVPQAYPVNGNGQAAAYQAVANGQMPPQPPANGNGQAVYQPVANGHTPPPAPANNNGVMMVSAGATGVKPGDVPFI